MSIGLFHSLRLKTGSFDQLCKTTSAVACMNGNAYSTGLLWFINDKFFIDVLLKHVNHSFQSLIGYDETRFSWYSNAYLMI